MKTIVKRAGSLLLVLCLSLAMLPATAFGADGVSVYIAGASLPDTSADIDRLFSQGWKWEAATKTLTLNGTYGNRGNIMFTCASQTDMVTLVVDGNVSISTSSLYQALQCTGNLTIKGSGQLMLTGNDTTNALQVSGSLTVESGNLQASSPYAYAIRASGVYITGSANVIATGTGTGNGSNGIYTSGNPINISTSGTVRATGTGQMYALFGSECNISSGTVFLSAADASHRSSSPIHHTGGTLCYSGLPPKITSLSPNTGSTKGGTRVTLTGENLSNTSLVNIAGKAVTGREINSDTSVAFTAPDGTAGTGDIYLETDNGATFLKDGFTYVLSPYDYEINLSYIDPAGGEGYTVSDGEIRLSHPGGKYCITGSTTHYVLSIPSAEGITLTLSDASIVSDSKDYALEVEAGAVLKLEGSNSLVGRSKGIYSSTSLTIDGTGTLNANGIHSSLVLTISGGIVKLTANDGAIAMANASNLAITGGTVTAVSTGQVYGIDIIGYGTIRITGGSVMASGGLGAAGFQPTNGSDEVYMTTLVGLPEDTKVTNLALPADYGYTGMKTDSEGKLYLWLPEGQQTVAFTAGSVNVNKNFLIESRNDNLFAAAEIKKNAGNAGELKAQLEEGMARTITLTGDIELATAVNLAANHTLKIPAGTTLTISGGGINVQNKTLAVCGGGTLVTAKIDALLGLWPASTLDLTDINLALQSGNGYDIRVTNVNVNSQAKVKLNSQTGRHLIHMNGGTLTVNSGGSIDIQKYAETAIYNAGGIIHINGGAIQVAQMEDYGYSLYNTGVGLLKFSGGTLAGGTLLLWQGSKIEGLGGRLVDRGILFTGNAQVTTNFASIDAAPDGLTSGVYFWNSGESRYRKDVITVTNQPQDIAEKQGEISGSMSVYATATNDETVGYQWWEVGEYGNLIAQIAGATGSTFNIPTDLTGGTYYYACRLSATGCENWSRLAKVTISGIISTVTVNGSQASSTGGGSYAQGDTVTINAGTRSGYTFTDWTSPDGVAFANAGSAGTTFIMPGTNVAVTANWRYNGGSSTPVTPAVPVTPTTITPEKEPSRPVTVTASIPATAGKDGTAEVTIPDRDIADAVAKAQANEKEQGKTSTGVSVELNITMPKGAASLTATLMQSSLQSFMNAGASSLELSGAPVSLSLDLAALQEIRQQSSGNVTIGFTPAAGLSEETQALIGSRPVYNVTISYVKDGRDVNVASLGSGTATLSIPYAPGRNEAVGYLFGIYVDESGKAMRIPGSAYDANAGAILIPTGHFSTYGVGYTAPSSKFQDISKHWAKESIDYVLGRGLLSGTSDTAFSPGAPVTGSMLAASLGKLANADVSSFKTSSFKDVKAGSTFQPYVEWAYRNGILQGIGNNKFAPNRSITREEIAVILSDFAKATGYTLPITRKATAYADNGSIGGACKDAVKAMQQAGIMLGGTGSKFNPKAKATRAEVSIMLHRYIKLTLDPATAQGWTLNDAGQHLYYKDGKALTGWQAIDGTRYYFEDNGTLKTGWVEDSGNWRFYAGNKASAGWCDIGADSSSKRYYFTTDGMMVSGKWLEIDGKWYYFHADGSLAVSTEVDGYEVDADGVRKTK